MSEILNVSENDRYKVITAPARVMLIEGSEFVGAYEVVNLETGITEFATPCRPEALRVAVQWDVALEKDMHLWPYQMEEGGNDGQAPLMLQ